MLAKKMEKWQFMPDKHDQYDWITFVADLYLYSFLPEKNFPINLFRWNVWSVMKIGLHMTVHGLFTVIEHQHVCLYSRNEYWLIYWLIEEGLINATMTMKNGPKREKNKVVQKKRRQRGSRRACKWSEQQWPRKRGGGGLGEGGLGLGGPVRHSS